MKAIEILWRAQAHGDIGLRIYKSSREWSDYVRVNRLVVATASLTTFGLTVIGQTLFIIPPWVESFLVGLLLADENVLEIIVEDAE